MTRDFFIPLLTIGFIIFIGYIIFAANTGTDSIFFRVLKDVPMKDKIAHFGLVGTLTFLINSSLKNRSLKLRHIDLLTGSLMVTCFITVEEFSQIWIAERTFDLLDLTSNYFGIFLASKANRKFSKP